MICHTTADSAGMVKYAMCASQGLQVAAARRSAFVPVDADCSGTVFQYVHRTNSARRAKTNNTHYDQWQYGYQRYQRIEQLVHQKTYQYHQ